MEFDIVKAQTTFLVLSGILAPVCIASPARADAKPAPLIQEGMVLQRGIKNPLWGTAAPGEKVSVYFNGASVATLADGEGKWRVDLPATKAGGPFAMTLQANNRIDYKAVYVGDVWVCSGQSNMEWPASASDGAEKLKQQPANDRIRLLKVGHQGQIGAWQTASPEAVLAFSGVGYAFGRALHEDQKVPIGLIQSAVGGTAVERWMSTETLKSLGYEQLKPDWGMHHRDMIRPLQPYAIKGAIWYQGESNTGNAGMYRKLFGGMIDEWRREWGQGAFPFLFVQLARIGKPGSEVGNWPALRQAQLETLELPATGMAVIHDVSDGDIHPKDKRSVGERLALIARDVAYGQNLAHNGPLLKSAKRSGSELILTFEHARGLHARDGFLRELEIKAAGVDFQPIAARIDGNKLILPVQEYRGPLTVRYAWRAHPTGNLYNAAGLPASPFKAENVR